MNYMKAGDEGWAVSFRRVCSWDLRVCCCFHQGCRRKGEGEQMFGPESDWELKGEWNGEMF